MNDLGSELVKRYGTLAVVAAIIIAPIVWSLAHFASAPGTPVKILWGLVEYTKASGDSVPKQEEPIEITVQRVEVQDAESKTPESSQSRPSIGAMTLSVSHGMTSDGHTEVLELLRKRNGLRELRPIESDRPINDSPPGTFFFVFGSALQTRDTMTGGKKLLLARADRLGSNSWAYYEWYHLNTNEILLLGYMAESDADRVRELTGDLKFKVTIAPRPWGSFSSLVKLPVERILTSKLRVLQVQEDNNLYVLDIVIH